MSKSSEKKKAGIVTLVGRSNVGKSTLLNALVGFKVSAVSPKAQTTRSQAQGVLNEERGQAVFVDTPGLFLNVPNKLTRAINKEVKDSLKGVDLLLYVVDPSREIGQEEQRLLSMAKNIKSKILVINKIDLPKLQYLVDYEELARDFDESIQVSSKTSQHLKGLVNMIYERLPEGEALYDEEAVHDQSFIKWLSEVIREKVFHHVHQEVPYSVHVEVEEVVKRKDGTLYIKARILTTDDRYRPMLIGKGAKKLKDIGSATRHELELVLRQKIYLDLEVGVDEHWVEKL